MTASREAGSSTAKVRSAQAGVSFCSAAVLFDLILHLNAMEPFDNETRRWCVQMQARIGRGWTQDETSERNAMGTRWPTMVKTLPVCTAPVKAPQK